MADEVSVRQATTPTVEIELDESLSDKDWFRVAFEQYETVLLKTQDECELSDDGLTVSVTLTQEETLLFQHSSAVRVQIRYKVGGSVQATEIGAFSMLETIDREVV